MEMLSQLLLMLIIITIIIIMTNKKKTNNSKKTNNGFKISDALVQKEALTFLIIESLIWSICGLLSNK
jgi:uncharacterized membrane protein